MRTLATSVRCFACASFLIAAGAARSPVLEPASDWQVEREAAECRLHRHYSGPSDELSFQIGLAGTSGAIQLELSGSIPRFGSPVNVGISQIPDGHSINRTAYFFRSSVDGEDVLKVLRFNLDSLGEFENDQLVELRIARRWVVQISFEGFHDALVALSQCNDALLAQWDVSLGQATAYPQPRGNPASWITYRDYPSALSMRGIEGAATFRLGVTPQGSVSDCVIVHSSGSTQLDEITCDRLSERARFTPAIDADGHPVASFYVDAAAFFIPR